MPILHAIYLAVVYYMIIDIQNFFAVEEPKTYTHVKNNRARAESNEKRGGNLGQ